MTIYGGLLHWHNIHKSEWSASWSEHTGLGHVTETRKKLKLTHYNCPKILRFKLIMHQIQTTTFTQPPALSTQPPALHYQHKNQINYKTKPERQHWTHCITFAKRLMRWTHTPRDSMMLGVTIPLLAKQRWRQWQQQNNRDTAMKRIPRHTWTAVWEQTCQHHHYQPWSPCELHLLGLSLPCSSSTNNPTTMLLNFNHCTWQSHPNLFYKKITQKWTTEHQNKLLGECHSKHTLHLQSPES